MICHLIKPQEDADSATAAGAWNLGKILESKNLWPNAHLDLHLDINMKTDLSLQERSQSRFYKWNLYLHRFLKLQEQKKKQSTTPCINRKMIPRYHHLYFSGSKTWDLPSSIYLVAWGSKTVGTGRVTEKEEKPVQGRVIKVCYGQKGLLLQTSGKHTECFPHSPPEDRRPSIGPELPWFSTTPSPTESKS